MNKEYISVNYNDSIIDRQAMVDRLFEYIRTKYPKYQASISSGGGSKRISIHLTEPIDEYAQNLVYEKMLSDFSGVLSPSEQNDE